jgi:K+-transporting ATPase ATPase C chain
MRRQLATGLRVLLLMSILLGVVYPLAVTAIARVAFPDEADGSLVEHDGDAVGSALLGQPFEGPEWFHPRPSSAGSGYDGASSSGSNLGPTNPDFLEQVATSVEDYRAANGLEPGARVPVDAVTGSGSGLDPHISVANARLQAPRVAAERGLPLESVLLLIEANVEDRSLGVLGDSGVNVLLLNLALETEAAR